jgi:hypothetical protein
MVHGTLYAEIWSALHWLAITARRADLCCITKQKDWWRIHSWNKISTESIDILQKLDSVVIVANGKISKFTLSADELAYLRQEITDAFHVNN